MYRVTVRVLVLLWLGSFGRVEAGDAIPLRFCLGANESQSMRVTHDLKMSYKIGSEEIKWASTRVFTLQRAVADVLPDKTMVLRVTIKAIQDTLSLQGQSIKYDSNSADNAGSEELGSHYSAFIGQSCTMKVNAEGKILDKGLDAFYLAVAKTRLEQEDKETRELLKDRAEEVINRTNQSHGSREKRLQAQKAQLEHFALFNRSMFDALVSDLTVPFPPEQVPVGGDWSAPIAAALGIDGNMNGVYSLKACEGNTCTIAVRGQRSTEDAPIIVEFGDAKANAKLSGLCEASADVDRKTGRLLKKQAKVQVTGEGPLVGEELQTVGSRMQVSLEAATTIDELK